MVGFLFGPRLYRLFQLGESRLSRKTGGRDYESNTLEWIGDSFINTVSYAISFSCYCSPVIAYYVYQRGLLSNHGQLFYYLRVIVGITIGLSAAYLIRGYGRSINPDYRKFLKDLLDARKSVDYRERLHLYDFEFSAWPQDFHWNDSTIQSNVKYEDLRDNINLLNILLWPGYILQYIMAHGIARPMVYPGSVKLLQLAMGPAVLDGRSSLIEKNGFRSKLIAEDGNEIDTMFIDYRNDAEKDNGNTLVICCEGNAAYYELGCMGTPMNGGYSVLGWNHPGFLGSTGLPNAESEKASVDVVIRYAVTRLGFNIENIVMFAWSIGGYTASYAAMMYPDMKGLILDATFDRIMPLALAKMPDFAAGIVESVIKNYMNLDNVRHVLKFPGPIRLIRRQRDELISLVPGDPSTNRGNYLLINLLLHRYPNIFVKESMEVVGQYLSVQDTARQNAIVELAGGINTEACESRLTIEEEKPKYPMDIGTEWPVEVKIETALYLSMMYMDHFIATHCIPLPSSYLRLPWQHRVKR